MDDLLSQDEINALLSGGDVESAGSSDFSMEDSQVLDEVASVFSNAESSVFGMLAGKDVNVQSKGIETCTQSELREKYAEKPFIFNASFGGFDDIALAFVVDCKGALTLADLMMGGEGKELPDEPSELYLNAAQEGLSQVVGSAFTSLSGLLGGRRLMPENTSSALGEEGWRPLSGFDDATKIWVSTAEVNIEGLDPFMVKVSTTEDAAKTIVETIRNIMNEKAAKPAAAQAMAAQPKAAAGSSSSGGFSSPQMAGAQQSRPMTDVHPAEFTPLVSRGATGGGGKIDLIADIPVRVTVELGKTRKNISEILGISTGSVIELDKMAGEPVDVLVNGKLIARGEVVVIDENFGVRITEVMSSARVSA